MAMKSEKAEQLVQEGISLSFNVMEGIYSEKKKSMTVVFVVLVGVLLLIAAALWISGNLVYAIPVGAGGLIVLIFLLVYDIRQLRALKKELDILYHYINH